MKRVWPIVMLGAAIVAGLAGATPIAQGQEPSSTRVTVVLAPYLTWDDLTPTSTPALWKLAQDGAVGGVNARSRVREPGRPPSPMEGALALSAGAWVVPSYSAAAAYNASETVEGSSSAATVYRRVFGTSMEGARVAYLGLPATARVNEANPTAITLGTLGQVIRDASGLTAALGNSDAGVSLGQPNAVRPAAIVAMDESGRVPYGDVSIDLLKPASDAPYGVVTDLAKLEAAYARVDALAKAHRGPSFIVLDPGDAYRAERFSASVTTEVAAGQRRAALRTLDAVVAIAQKRRGADGVVMVVSQALYVGGDGLPEGLGPIVVAGPGWSGYLSSPSTHQTGVVTTLDVTASVLDMLGIARPVQVVGDAMESVEGPASVEQRAAHLERMNAAAVAIDVSKPPVLAFFIALVVFSMGFSAVVVAQGHRWTGAGLQSAVRALKTLLLLVLSIPVSCWLMFLVTPLPSTPATAVVSLVGTTAVVWLLAIVAERKVAMRLPVAGLCLATVAVLVGDQLLGAPLSFVGFLGYSPLTAARFYGMGNYAASVLFGAGIVGSALLLDHLGSSRRGTLGRRYGIVGLGVVVVAVAAAPFWGANVGVAIWGTVGFAIAWTLMNGRRFDWRIALGTAVLVVVVIGVFAAADLWGGGAQTHLGRSLTSAEAGGVSQLSSIVVRKAQTNARVLAGTNWTWILLSVLAFLAFVRLRFKPLLAASLAENPCFAAAIPVTLTAGAVAFFTEDSGIVIPAIIMLYTGVGLSWLLVSRMLAEQKGPGS